MACLASCQMKLLDEKHQLFSCPCSAPAVLSFLHHLSSLQGGMAHLPVDSPAMWLEAAALHWQGQPRNALFHISKCPASVNLSVHQLQ